jgi:hypothetical protein
MKKAIILTVAAFGLVAQASAEDTASQGQPEAKADGPEGVVDPYAQTASAPVSEASNPGDSQTLDNSDKSTKKKHRSRRTRHRHSKVIPGAAEATQNLNETISSNPSAVQSSGETEAEQKVADTQPAPEAAPTQSEQANVEGSQDSSSSE